MFECYSTIFMWLCAAARPVLCDTVAVCGAAVRCVRARGKIPACAKGACGGKSRAHRVTVRVEARPWGGEGGGPGEGEKKRGRSKKTAYSTTDSLVVPHRSTEVA